MIYGIAGKIGSGKDTVGKIIQWINCRGPKPLLVDSLHPHEEWWLEDGSGFEIKKFASKIKQIASILTGEPLVKWEDQEFKAEFMPEAWGLMTYRDLLQKIGTEAMRDVIHKDIWVNAMFADYYHTSKWIITDVRFPNEADRVLAKGGMLIRVVRDSKYNSYHPSETALDNYKHFDVTITNDGTLEQLYEKVATILEEWKK